ncbi:MAG: class I SAM-dependent methyltransferase [Candidatus Binatia bacterium]
MDEKLFRSASQMAEADNYSDWTCSLFERYLTGQVLEIGCGVGTFTRRILDRGKPERLLSIDVSADAIEYCRATISHPALEFQCVDARRIQGEFDNIICMNVLEHIEDDQAALEHILSLLKPGATLFLLVPAHRFLFTPFDVAGGHFRRYTKKYMRQLIRSVSNGSTFDLQQCYFNIIGAIGYFISYRVLHKVPHAGAAAEIAFFDSFVVPVMRRIESRHMPFGISLVTIASKK